MKKASLFIITLLSAILLQSCGNKSPDSTAGNDTSGRKAAANTTKKGINDYNTQFAVDAANSGRAKVVQGKLAMEKGSSRAVKNFGKDMIDQYSAVNKTLADLTERKNMTVPRAQGMDEQKVMDSLGQKKGIAFDKAYINHMMEIQQKEIKYFEEAEQKLTDNDLRAFASNTLPILRKLLFQCKEVRYNLD